jgi:hypothetical protein
MYRYLSTGCASYFWTTFKQLGWGPNIIFEFVAFQTKYSLVSAETKTQTKGPVAATGDKQSHHYWQTLRRKALRGDTKVQQNQKSHGV